MIKFIQRVTRSQTILHVKKIFFFLRISKVNMWFIPLSVLLSVCYTQIALYVVYLLFPLTKGIIANDFTHVRDLKGIGLIVKYNPSFFNTSTKLFILLVVWVYLATIVKNIFYYFAMLCVQVQARMATVRLRQMLVEKCLSFGKSFYDKNTVSYLQTVLTKSTELIESRFKLLQQFTTEVLLIASYLFLMFQISWKLTLITGLFFPVVSVITQQIVQRIRNASLEQQQLSRNLNEKIFNMLYCMPVIKSFSKEQEEVRAFSKASETEIERSFRVQRLTGLASPVEDVGAMTGNLFIALAMAAVMRMDHGFNPASAFVFFYLATKTIPGLNAFNRFKLGMANSASSLDDVEQILTHGDSFIVASGKMEWGEFKESIEFKNLSFSYTDKSAVVLDRVSFSIKKRSIVAIVGSSGSGKSTLMNLLLRFYDCPSGQILIDGQDIRDYNISSLRKKMALISQDVLLFNDTIRNNIIYGSTLDVSDDSLRSLTRSIRVHDFIDQMSGKYETLVGERGTRLSGGERQRLAIARGMIKDSEILIMDEATSALDSATEEAITEGILSLAKEKTMIIIAHRLSTIKKADKIVYLEKGHVVETGTLQELIDKKGFFYKQWQAQKI
ncbi:MAG: ABC transporter ATP-binding protein [Candidatus Omnitrophica bacterium]|nr:ABC transporter ATP-binding protein [Candidatus Omnitrophota bacterium]